MMKCATRNHASGIQEAVKLDAIEFIIIVAGLAGQALVTRQNRWGFVFWIVGNIALSWVFFGSGKFALIALHAVYSALQLWGFLTWKDTPRCPVR